ncbi:hypothetical protein [Halobacillus litoralis]|uniref:hypothetical protein n=1 Tax=Halobacillus litoralis TaxID=45668 RepID=UPI00136A23A6|nr:hypothetical protein [Halobacillus litoralis]MYL37358.1 hypothetical protein [Halobacillus litoralis]
MDGNQRETIHKIEKLLVERGLRARTIGSTDFPNVSPMKAVEQLMRQCSGAVILGFPQTVIHQGISKPNTQQEKNITDKQLPTPWNQIEASMAFMIGIPLLIIRQQGIEGGIFDIGTTGHYIHTFNLDNYDWIREPSFLQPFNEWYREVLVNNN